MRSKTAPNRVGDSEQRVKKLPIRAAWEVVIIHAAPGSKAFFESIVIPGAKIKRVSGHMGRVYITLLVDADSDLENLCQQYLEACVRQTPIGQEIIVSAEKLDA